MMATKQGLLVLVRHGQSEWNSKELYTGREDPDLTEQGIAEAKTAGRRLKEAGFKFDVAFTSALRRAQHTAELILAELDQHGLQRTTNTALDERDFGELSGLSRAQARERWGKHLLRAWRRSFDAAPPGGESLEDTARRVLPFFYKEVLPRAQGGQHVLISAHRHSLRALIMALENLSWPEVLAREIAAAVPILYDVTPKGLLAARPIPVAGFG